MQQHAIVQPGQGVARTQHVDEHRIAGQQALQALCVGRGDTRLVHSERGEESCNGFTARRRRAPVEVHRFDAARGQIVGKGAQPDVDDARRLAK